MFPRRAGKQLSGLGWSSVIPFKVAVLNPEPLKGTPELTFMGQWECSVKLPGLQKPGYQRSGALSAFCSMETFKQEQNENIIWV